MGVPHFIIHILVAFSMIKQPALGTHQTKLRWAPDGTGQHV